MLLFTGRENPQAALINLLKNLSINIDAETIDAELDKHPGYPQLTVNACRNYTRRQI